MHNYTVYVAGVQIVMFNCLCQLLTLLASRLNGVINYGAALLDMRCKWRMLYGPLHIISGADLMLL